MPFFATRAAGAIKAFGLTAATTAITIARDTYFRFNGLLLKANTGTPLDTIKELPPPVNLDNSGNNFALTTVGTPRASIFNPLAGTYYSTFFDGSSSVDFALSTTGAAAFGTNDFTIEFWVYPTAAPATNWTPFISIGTSGGGSEIRISQNINATGYGVLFPNNTNSADTYVGYGTLQLGAWHHLALVRSGSNVLFFRNGNLINTWTGISFNFTNTTLFRTGSSQPAYSATDGSYTGYIYGLRIIKGSALYTAAFTVPTSPLTLVTNTTFLAHNFPRFLDQGSNLTVTINTTPKITEFVPLTQPTAYEFYGSVYLNGSTDGLTIPYNTALDILSSDFTVEAWVFPQSTATYQTIIGQWNQTVGQSGYMLFVSGSNITFFFGAYSEATALLTSSLAIKLNVWYHVVVTRSASTFTMFINGSSASGATATSAATRAGLTGVGITVGNYYAAAGTFGASGASYYQGYINNIRVLKGVALYTSSFTLNNTLLTAISGTSLLTFQYNGSNSNNMFVDKSGISAVVTRAGDVSQGTFSPYSGSYSTFFNGTTDYLTLPTAPTFGTSAFTVEFWMYATSLAAIFSILSTSATGGLNCRVKSSTVLSFDCQNTSNLDFTVNTLVVNTWYHIVFVRNASNQATVFVNGTRSSSGAQTLATNYSAASNYVGLINTNYFPGYLSNLRVYVGTAVYDPTLTAITVPVKTLTPNIVNNTACTLLLCTDGTITDKSRNNYSITLNGSTKTSLISPFSPTTVTQNQGNFSVLFSSSWVNTPSLSIYNIGTGDFTIEFWFYTTSVAGNYCTYFNLGQYTNGILYRQNFSGIEVYFVNSQIITPTGTIAVNTWYHTALTRSGTSVSLYLNGARIANPTSSASISPTSSLLIGTSAHATTTEYFPGYISNLRFVIGSSLYTGANLTIPTSPLTAVAGTVFLSLNNNALVDVSQNTVPVSIGGGTPKVTAFSPFLSSPTTVTLGTLTTPYVVGGSMYFDGTGDYFTIPANPTYALSGDFTIEMWLFPTAAIGAYRALITTGGIGSNDQFIIGTDASILGMYCAGVNAGNSVIPTINVWTHVAVSRTGTSVYFFLNGVQQGTTKTSSNLALSGTATVSVGYRVAASDGAFTGYIADLRVIRGRALYAANFLPPTLPVSNTSDTILLLRGDGAGIFDSTGGNNLQALGGAKVSTAIKKFNSGSMQFNGSTDYMLIPGNPLFNNGTSDFTVDCWVYLNALPTSDAWPTNQNLHMVILGSGTATTADGFDCIIGQTKLLVHASDVQYASTNTHNMVINTWYHVVYMRSSNVMYFYLNGSSLGSVAFTPSLSTGAFTFIGSETGQTAYLNGYIDDLRFTRLARYSGPFFTLPTDSPQETGPNETDPGTTGVTYVAGDGLTSATAGLSAAAIKAQTGTNADGAYWINLPTAGPTQVYCIMNSAVSGGGWMMAMKATTGTTFAFTANHWTTVTTLNPTDFTRANADAKFNTMNYYAATDIMALFPDITTNGGSLGTNPFSCWSWLESNFNGGTTTTLINFFNTAGTYNTGTVNTAGNYGGKFIKDAKTFSGWQSGVFSSQPDIRFYGFNYKNGGLTYGGTGSVRWGFGWNENGEGLYSSPATLAGGSATGSNDVWGGIGLDVNGGSYSAGDKISCCQDTTGINRSARVEIYIR